MAKEKKDSMGVVVTSGAIEAIRSNGVELFLHPNEVEKGVADSFTVSLVSLEDSESPVFANAIRVTPDFIEELEGEPQAPLIQLAKIENGEVGHIAHFPQDIEMATLVGVIEEMLGLPLEVDNGDVASTEESKTPADGS